MVYSAFRFALATRALGRPVAALSLGRSPADDLLNLKVSEDCAEVLDRIVERLAASDSIVPSADRS